MADYLTRTLARALNQLLLLFGGILVLAFLLCTVATEIRRAGSSVLGTGYYYLVAPGVVCHETGHALGCLVTGTKIRHFEPFRVQGRRLGYVKFRPYKNRVLQASTECIVASGPVWFGCFMIWLLSKVCSRFSRTPRFREVFPLDPIPSSGKYWLRVSSMAFRHFLSIVKVWRLGSTWNVLYVYLTFCIASEMVPSLVDLLILWPGFMFIAVLFLVLNIVPRVGMAVSVCVYRLGGFIFPIHVNLVFSLLLSLVFYILFALPIRILH